MKRLSALLLMLSLCLPMAVSVHAQQDNVTTLVEGSSAFAFNLYGQLRQEAEGNLLFSPFSVSQALAMTYAGAEGTTEAQMADVLHFSLPEPDLHAALQTLNDDLIERGTGDADPDRGESARALHIANGLWGEQTYPFDDAFLGLLAEYYGAGLQLTDFINAPQDAREEINSWVEDQTEDRIQDIVPEDAITEMTRLVLANAIYFYGGWADTFEESNTSDEDFHLLDGSTVTVPLMFQHESFPYAQADGYQVIDIPYARSGLTFTVILPDERQFEAIEDHLDATMLDDAVAQLEYTDAELYLPKFEFEFAAGLSDALQSLGMTDAFNEGADFTGMMGDSPPGPLLISDVLHKAFISVDESGTEAAAATVVIMVEGAAPIDPVEPVVVRIDRPFIFAIRDAETGAILFLGRVLNPAS